MKKSSLQFSLATLLLTVAAVATLAWGIAPKQASFGSVLLIPFALAGALISLWVVVGHKGWQKSVPRKFKDEDVVWAVRICDEDSPVEAGDYEILKLFLRGGRGVITAVIFTESEKAERHAKSLNPIGNARSRVVSCTFGEYRKWLCGVYCQQVAVDDEFWPVSEFVDADPA